MFNKVDGKKYRFVIIFSDLFQYLLKDKSLIVNFCDKLVDLIPSLSKDTTIILPTFNLKFYKTLITGNSACYITTGFLNKTLLKHLHFQRTKKPIGNYSVIGLDSKKILNIQQNSLFGEDSVINFLSKQSTLGVGSIDLKTLVGQQFTLVRKKSKFLTDIIKDLRVIILIQNKKFLRMFM